MGFWLLSIMERHSMSGSSAILAGVRWDERLLQRAWRAVRSKNLTVMYRLRSMKSISAFATAMILARMHPCFHSVLKMQAVHFRHAFLCILIVRAVILHLVCRCARGRSFGLPTGIPMGFFQRLRKTIGHSVRFLRRRLWALPASDIICCLAMML